MIEENINKKASNCRVLIAPLDWGLGHTTRCIPIIRSFLKQNAQVFLAAEGESAALLMREFPSIPILLLQGYRITYGKSKRYLFFHLLLQLPRILQVIRNEKKWLKKTIEFHQINLVISDNRFGLNNPGVTCIYISHQLFIETGNKLFNLLAQKIHYHYINRFSEIWVPDAEGKNNLAGKLSHPKKFPAVPIKYLGIVSRFARHFHEKEIDLLVILSGPEPQRTIFENLLIEQLKKLVLSVVMVRGLPGDHPSLLNTGNIEFYNHAAADQLSTWIQKSHLVVARCGYSTIMDLAVLKQKAVLVPTPGQTEQEYLGRYLQEKKYFLVKTQRNLTLDNILQEAGKFEFSSFDIDRFNEIPS